MSDEHLTETQRKFVEQETARRRALAFELCLTIMGISLLALGVGYWVHPGAGLAAAGAAIVIEMKLGD